MSFLFKPVTIVNLVTSFAIAANFETNLTKGGEFRCYSDGPIIVCTKSRCFDALIREMRNEVKFAQRKEICTQESVGSGAVSKPMLRLLTDPSFAKSIKEVGF